MSWMVSDSLSMFSGPNTVETQKCLLNLTSKFSRITCEKYSSAHRDLSMFSLGKKIPRRVGA